MKIVCLANSWKEGGRCVAGIDLDSGRWVRPVSNSAHGELSTTQSSAIDGANSRAVRPLDILEIGEVAPRPEPGQPENVQLGRTPWFVSGRASASLLDSYVTKMGPLLHGVTDRVPGSRINEVSASLALIKVQNPTFKLNTNFGKSQLRAVFDFWGHRYDLSVTDVSAWTQEARRGPERFSGGVWFFTVSLGTEFKGSRYKLVACGLQP